MNKRFETVTAVTMGGGMFATGLGAVIANYSVFGGYVFGFGILVMAGTAAVLGIRWLDRKVGARDALSERENA